MSDNEKFKRLFEFCVKGDRIGLADYIITNSCNPSAYDAHDSLGRTALHIACQHGHLFTVRSLIEVFGCHQFVRDNAGNLPVHYACLHNHLPIVDYLLHFKGVNITNAVFETDSEGNNLLHKACQSGSARVVRYLQAILCYNSKGHVFRKLNLYHDSHETYNLATSVKLLLHRKLLLIHCLLTKNKRGDTPLHIACRHGHLPILKIFKVYIPLLQHLKLSITASKSTHYDVAAFILTAGTKLAFVDVDSESLLGGPVFPNIQSFELLTDPIIEKERHLLKKRSIQCQSCKELCDLKDISDYNPNDLTGVCPTCSNYRSRDRFCFHCNKCNKNFVDQSLKCRRCSECFFDGEINLINSIINSEPPRTMFENDNQFGFAVPYISVGHSAAQSGNIQAYKQIEDVHLVLPSAETLLHAACISDNVFLVDYIMATVKCGIDVVDSNGATPLHVACEWGSLKVFSHLSRLIVSVVDIPNKESLLLLACQHNCVDLCKKVIAVFGCVTLQSNDLETPLHVASANNNIELVMLIVEEGGLCFIDSTDQFGDTPLFNACRCRNLEMVKYLIEKGSNPLFVNAVTKETVAHIACRMGNSDILCEVIKKPMDNPLLENWYGVKPIHLAIDSDCKKCVELLVEHTRMDLNQVLNNRLQTLAHFVSMTKKLEFSESCLKVLHDSLDWNAMDCNGTTALHKACMSDNENVVKLIVDVCSITLQTKNTLNTPVHFTAQLGSMEIFRLLMQRKSQIAGSLDEYRDINGETLLHLACRRNFESSYEMVSTLCEYCSVTAQTKKLQTPLHIACQTGNIAVVRFLSERFNGDYVDEEENTVLHIASENDSLEVVTTVLSLVSPVCKNKNGETPIHIACRKGSIDIVRALVGKKVDLVYTTSGNSYLHSACKGESLEVVEFLLKESGLDCSQMMVENGEGNTPLHCAFQEGLLDIILFLLNCNQWHILQKRNKSGLTPFYCILASEHVTVTRQLLSITDIDINILYTREEPLLHCILKYSKDVPSIRSLVRFIVENDICDPLACDSEGYSILHYFFIRIMEWYLLGRELHPYLDLLLPDLLDYLLEIPRAQINKQNQCGNSLLHTFAMHSQYNVYKIEYLEKLLRKADIRDSVNTKNAEKKTPIQLAQRGRSTRLLIKYGANPGEVSEQLTSILNKFKKKHPLKPSIKIVVVGNSKAGKTTLIETIKHFDSPNAASTEPIVVESPTTGVKITDHTSQVLGRITFHDFGGQPEFESVNAAFLSNAVSLDYPPIFLLLVDITRHVSQIARNTQYWLSYIRNCIPNQLEVPPHVVVIGSHADSIQNTENFKCHFKPVVEKLFCDTFRIADPILLDCRAICSEQIQKLHQVLADSSTSLQKTLEIDCRCHVLYAFLSNWFANVSVVKFSDVQAKVDSETGSKYYDSDILLPTTTPDLLPLLESLHSGGHIVLLNRKHVDNCWIVLDSKLLFEKVNGTLFCPSDPGFHPKLPKNIGVLTRKDLESLFGTEHLESIIAYVMYSEFCQKIEDSEVLQLIETACSTVSKNGSERTSMLFTPSHLSEMQTDTAGCIESDTTSITIASTTNELETYFFFPGLVKRERPNNVWSDGGGDSSYTFSWCLICYDNNFLDTRFLQVLLLRLTFNFATAVEQLRCYCNIWKNGIHWSTHQGVEVLVEIVEQNTAVVLLMRFTEGLEIEGVKLRSKIIKKILVTKKEFCQNVEVTEFVLPKTVQYPINIHQAAKISISEVARAFTHNYPIVIDLKQKNHLLSKLLYYEPPLDSKSIEYLWSETDEQKEVSSELLLNISQSLKKPTHKEMRERGKELIEQIDSYLNRDKMSYEALRKLIGSFSIFGDRNPLKLASVKEHYPEMYDEESPNINAPSFSIVTQRLQDHNIGADNPLQSLPPHSIVSQDSQITNVITIRTVTEKIGSSVVSLPTSAPVTHNTSGPCKVTVNELKKEFNISDDQLGNRVEKSDIKNLASFFGDVELYLPGLRLCEADDADVRTAVHLHGNQTGMNKALTIWINSYKATFKDLISIALDVRKAIVAERICKHLQQNNHSESSLPSSSPP